MPEDQLSTTMSPVAKPKPKRRSRRKLVARILMAIFALVIIGGVAFALRPKPLRVDLATIERGDLDIVLEEDGRTRVRARFVVSAPLQGRLMRIDLRAGDPVVEGQPLATLLPQLTPLLDANSVAEAEARASAASASVLRAKASVDRAKTARDLAKTETARADQLAAAGALPRVEFERLAAEERLRVSDLATAEFGSQVARYEEALARVVLGRSKPGDAEKSSRSLTVSSPVRGRVLKVLHESEGVVAPGTPLLEVGDPLNLEITVDVLTADAVRVRPGQAASVVRWGGDELLAHVRLVEPSAVTKLSALGVEEQRVDVVLDVDTPQDRWAQMGDGYRVEVRIVTERIADTVLVPVGALFRKGDASHVYVVDAQGSARDRAIELGAQGQRLAAVRSGLEAGDRVILHPSDKVVEGVRIEAR